MLKKKQLITMMKNVFIIMGFDYKKKEAVYTSVNLNVN